MSTFSSPAHLALSTPGSLYSHSSVHSDLSHLALPSPMLAAAAAAHQIGEDNFSDFALDSPRAHSPLSSRNSSRRGSIAELDILLEGLNLLFPQVPTQPQNNRTPVLHQLKIHPPENP
jgi:hypothetical protein